MKCGAGLRWIGKREFLYRELYKFGTVLILVLRLCAAEPGLMSGLSDVS